MKQRPILLAAAAALMSTAAFAQTEDQTSAFKALDADKSGSISAEEAKVVPVVAQSFNVADKNHDGTLTQDEFNASFTTKAPPPLGESSQTSPAQPPR